MPSTDAPTHYDRPNALAPSSTDFFTKMIDPDWAEADTGSVDSPLGHIMLVKVDSQLTQVLIDMSGGAWPADSVLDEGWYIVRADDNGLVWAMCYGDLDSTLAEENARADFAEAEAVYAAWACEEECGQSWSYGISPKCEH